MANPELSNIIQESIENILLIEKQLQERDPKCCKENRLSNDEFWKQVDNVASKLSYECTKTCISFCNAPPPSNEATSALLRGIEACIVTLLSALYNLNTEQGITMYKSVNEASIEAIQAVRKLLRVIKEDGSLGVAARYRQATGVAWQGCRALESVPRDNKESVLNLVKKQSALVSDAFEEINNALNNTEDKEEPQMDDDTDVMDEEPFWTNEDRDCIMPAVNLIKATKLLYKLLLEVLPTNGSCNEVIYIEQLDAIADDFKMLPIAVDNLTLELYPPLDTEQIRIMAIELKNTLLSALKTIAQSHIVSEGHQNRIEFIQSAVEHNSKKLQDALNKT